MVALPQRVLSVAGVVLLYLFLVGVSTIIAIICVRYRDIPPLIQVFIQFLFFLTPIIWYPEQIKFGSELLKLNPMTYMLMIVRDPVLGRPIEVQTWIIAIGLSAASLIAGSPNVCSLSAPHRILGLKQCLVLLSKTSPSISRFCQFAPDRFVPLRSRRRGPSAERLLTVERTSASFGHWIRLASRSTKAIALV